MWRLLYFLPIQIAYLILWTTLCLLGHVVCPPLLYLGLKRRQKIGNWPWQKYSAAYSHYYEGFPDTAYLWSNEGDSVLGSDNYQVEKAAENWSPFRIAWTWTCVRNPVNNARFTFLGVKIDPAKVRWTGSLGTYCSDVDAPQYNIQQGLSYDSKEKEFTLLCWLEGTLYFNFLHQYRNKDGVMMKLQTGWKIYPKDLQGFNTPYRASGAGNAALSWRKV